MRSTRTRMRRTALTCALAFATLAAAAEPLERRIELAPVYFESAGGVRVLQTSIAWGEIHVAEHDHAWVAVEADVTTGVGVEPIVRGGDVELRVHAGEGFHGIDLRVLVPRGTALSLEVRRGGNIAVDGAGGAVEISNRNGSVELRGLRGSAVVNARNGSITASFDEVDRDAPMAFSSMNGSVDVTFPREIAAELSIRYNRGDVESAFEIESLSGTGPAFADVAGLDGRETRVLRGRINGGGPRYYFETANGTVYLRR